MNEYNLFLENFTKLLKNSINICFKHTPAKLKEACEYALLGNGKRIRPYLMYLSSKFFGLDFKRIEEIALSIEYIHSYSLVHDDLPSMDNDDYRRGKPTVHKLFGETMGLLCGDTLLNTAYEILFAFLKKNPGKANVCSLVANRAGCEGMIGGQVKEFLSENSDYDDYKDIIRKKTGGLIYASIMTPAFYINNCDKSTFDAISLYADNIGMLFQLTDDYLDIDKHEPHSAAVFFNKSELVEIIKSLSSETIDLLKRFDYEKTKDLIDCCNYVTTRTF